MLLAGFASSIYFHSFITVFFINRFCWKSNVGCRVILVATHPDVAQCQKNIKGLWEMDGKAGLVNKLLKSFGADLLIAPYFHIMNAHEAASQE